MSSLDYKHKLSIAKQFNLIVRTINDYQLANWNNREATEFCDLIKTEKDILTFAGQLVEDFDCIEVKDPDKFVNNLEKLGEDIRMQLKYCKLDQAHSLVVQTNRFFSSLFINHVF